MHMEITPNLESLPLRFISFRRVLTQRAPVGRELRNLPFKITVKLTAIWSQRLLFKGIVLQIKHRVARASEILKL